MATGSANSGRTDPAGCGRRRRPETAEVALWLLDGGRARRRLRASLPAGHRLAGVEDRDGDGRDEVRWVDAEGRSTVSRLAPAR